MDGMGGVGSLGAVDGVDAVVAVGGGTMRGRGKRCPVCAWGFGFAGATPGGIIFGGFATGATGATGAAARVMSSGSKVTVPWVDPDERTTVVPRALSGLRFTETTLNSSEPPGSMTFLISGFFLLMIVILCPPGTGAMPVRVKSSKGLTVSPGVTGGGFEVKGLFVQSPVYLTSGSFFGVFAWTGKKAKEAMIKMRSVFIV